MSDCAVSLGKQTNKRGLYIGFALARYESSAMAGNGEKWGRAARNPCMYLVLSEIHG